ncbi:MAG: diacylglycerol O-acyltransferase / wax synthase, partial [Ilumatobacteraceae bacterium]
RTRSTANTQTIPNDTQMLLNAVGDLMRHPPWFTRAPADATPARSPTLIPAGELPSRWKSPLNATITPHRSVAFVDIALDDVRAVKDRIGCTVNDVVLALCAGALRRLIDRSGLINAPSLVAGVPVSIRTEAERGAMGNRVSFMLVPLATDKATPLERLQAIHEHTTEAKSRHDPVAARALMDWAVAGGPPLVAQAARLYSQLRVADLAEPDCHVVVSNIPGPTGRLYCANSLMTALYPTGPLSEGAGLNITLGSYAGQLNISLITCPEVVPDGARIARELHDELAELLVATENER